MVGGVAGRGPGQMDTVLVHYVDAGGRSRQVGLDIGTTVAFGRGAPTLDVPVLLPDQGVPRLAGEITAVADHWTLTNLSRDRTYVVDNPEGAGEHVKVPPGRVAAPIPFEIARVLVPVRRETATFSVFAPGHTYLDADQRTGSGGDRTLAAFPLDESAKYFLVLVALCELRLRDQSHVAIPTVEAVVERLRPLPECRDLTVAAVNFHIDYLARSKLRVKDDSYGGPSPRLDSKRAALVSLALRFDLVREDHLGLLPGRRAARHAVTS
jgi:hypothetical protein